MSYQSMKIAAAILLAAGLLPAHADEHPAVFKVCAPPHNLPFSNEEQQGFENKLAKLFADELQRDLAYEWFPQRIGFIRNTLRNNDTEDGSYKCDVVMGVVDNFELAITTRPYYRSSWAIVYVKGRGLDDIKSQADLAELPAERKAELDIGSFDQGPGTDWLFKHGMVENIRPYQIMPGDVRANAGRILEQDLVAGDIDVMLVWGPIAGYYAKKIAEERGEGLVVIPLRDEGDIQFEYNISMAVRFGEQAWRDQLNEVIQRNEREIAGLLAEYNFPILPIPEAALQGGRDDDDD